MIDPATRTTLPGMGWLALWDAENVVMPFDDFKAACVNAGLSVPVRRRTIHEALLAAMTTIYKTNKDITIESVDGPGSVAVRKCHNPADLSIQIETIQGARIDSHGELHLRSELARGGELRDAYAKALLHIDAIQISEAGSFIVRTLDGVFLFDNRNGRGICALPSAGISKWERLNDELRRVRRNTETVFSVVGLCDTETVRAAVRGLVDYVRVTGGHFSKADQVDGPRDNAYRSRRMADLAITAQEWESTLTELAQTIRIQATEAQDEATRYALMA